MNNLHNNNLSEEYMILFSEIRSFIEKYELPYGVKGDGELLTLPDPMFIIFLEQELYELKERLGYHFLHVQTAKNK